MLILPMKKIRCKSRLNLAVVQYMEISKFHTVKVAKLPSVGNVKSL